MFFSNSTVLGRLYYRKSLLASRDPAGNLRLIKKIERRIRMLEGSNK